MKVCTPYGEATLQVLPDSGAGICAAGPQLVHSLGEHIHNLTDSTVTTPKAVNCSLYTAGKIPNGMFELNGRHFSEDVHIYKSVSRTIISWSVTQMLGILPDSYPNPLMMPPHDATSYTGAKPGRVASTVGRGCHVRIPISF